MFSHVWTITVGCCVAILPLNNTDQDYDGKTLLHKIHSEDGGARLGGRFVIFQTVVRMAADHAN